MAVTDLLATARRFPLIARPRPVCSPLHDRVQKVRLLARDGGGPDGLGSASAALNRAALIAGDCGLPGMAHDLCRRHADLYFSARPLTAREARYALEPLVNLARLHIRAGEGHEAHRLLDGLARADLVIDGRSLPLHDLLLQGEDRVRLDQWLWTVLLSEGARALVVAQEWQKAWAHVRRCKGVGLRLLDGRQIEIVARCLGGDPLTAHRMVPAGTPAEPWEDAVAACLTAFCLLVAEADLRDAAERAVRGYLDLEPVPELAVFRTRVGLTALTFSSRCQKEQVARNLVRDAARFADGYVAKEVLEDAACAATLTGRERRELITTVEAAGLAAGNMPPEAERTLSEAVDVAADAVVTHLRPHRLRPVPPELRPPPSSPAAVAPPRWRSPAPRGTSPTSAQGPPPG